MKINIDAVNSEIEKNKDIFISNANFDFEERLKIIGEDIIKNMVQKPVVLLSGPSGSGKTTTAKMLEKYLENKGFGTHILSIDNYFKSMSKEEIELSHEHKLDMESPDRVNGEFLTHQLESIINCEPVELPKYNFIDSASEKSGVILKRLPGEIVIIEGTHALNPDVISLPDERTAKMYVSVRTRVTYGELTLHPRKIRLLRRMIRDRNFRGRELEQTVKKYNSVNNGEELYIMPYKYRSDYETDTFFAYEPGIYRSLLQNEINKLGKTEETDDIKEILNAAKPIDLSEIPASSLIREFTGGGVFEY